MKLMKQPEAAGGGWHKSFMRQSGRRLLTGASRDAYETVGDESEAAEAVLTRKTVVSARNTRQNAVLSRRIFRAKRRRVAFKRRRLEFKRRRVAFKRRRVESKRRRVAFKRRRLESKRRRLE
ncbi:MAG: hypothetical protein LBD24_09020, partial [Spirochaetaceae bacterium]|nr:hypothetical protein [Spirochaetaceae bacterium]